MLSLSVSFHTTVISCSETWLNKLYYLSWHLEQSTIPTTTCFRATTWNLICHLICCPRSDLPGFTTMWRETHTGKTQQTPDMAEPNIEQRNDWTHKPAQTSVFLWVLVSRIDSSCSSSWRMIGISITLKDDLLSLILYSEAVVFSSFAITMFLITLHLYYYYPLLNCEFITVMVVTMW